MLSSTNYKLLVIISFFRDDVHVCSRYDYFKVIFRSQQLYVYNIYAARNEYY